ARLEAELGGTDPYLVPVLDDVCDVSLRLGDKPAAVAALHRAVGILEATPDAPAERLSSLRQRIRELEPASEKAA
ncbi:MAG TPA: hypothetical protein VK447_04810, partial [Myxococcaceae bacterium]|nr:hypothetical protein [Myxococcaceae bacterium]